MSTHRLQQLYILLLGIFLAQPLELLPSVILVLCGKVECACNHQLAMTFWLSERHTWSSTSVVPLVGLFEVGVKLSISLENHGT